MKQRLTESIGPLLESNPTSMVKSPARSSLTSGYCLINFILWHLHVRTYLVQTFLKVNLTFFQLLLGKSSIDRLVACPVHYSKLRSGASHFWDQHRLIVYIQILYPSIVSICNYGASLYQDMKAETNVPLNLRAAGADGSLFGVPGV